MPGDFNRPGHVFPLRPREGGVLERDGHTEASVDFCKLAGLHECGVLSEICNEDGSMSRVPEVRAAAGLAPERAAALAEREGAAQAPLQVVLAHTALTVVVVPARPHVRLARLLGARRLVDALLRLTVIYLSQTPELAAAVLVPCVDQVVLV